MKRLILPGVAALAALGGCASPGGGGPGPSGVLLVTMTGLQEVPGPGDPDGSGTAELRVSPGEGRICWNLYARGIDQATAAHIHRGAAGIPGPPVVSLTTPDAAGRNQGCTTIDEGLAREIAMQGHGFYVNVHTGPYPAGAIRGQMRGGARPRDRDRGIGVSPTGSQS